MLHLLFLKDFFVAPTSTEISSYLSVLSMFFCQILLHISHSYFKFLNRFPPEKENQQCVYIYREKANCCSGLSCVLMKMNVRQSVIFKENQPQPKVLRAQEPMCNYHANSKGLGVQKSKAKQECTSQSQDQTRPLHFSVLFEASTD